jgi:hypothetical protein
MLINLDTRRTSSATCNTADTRPWKKALALPPKTTPEGTMLNGPEQLRQEVMISGLRGRGGAAFSCGLKWSFVDRKSGKPIYLICNADESEPGTFKDRKIIYRDPYQLLEGTVISCYANEVHLVYIYARGEFVEGARILQRAIAEAEARNLLGKDIFGYGTISGSTSTAAPGPTSAARKPGSSNRWKANARTPGSSRHTSRPSSACTSAPPSSITSKPSVR